MSVLRHRRAQPVPCPSWAARPESVLSTRRVIFRGGSLDGTAAHLDRVDPQPTYYAYIAPDGDDASNRVEAYQPTGAHEHDALVMHYVPESRVAASICSGGPY